MELGATLCGPVPQCPACPLREACQAHLQGSAGRIPLAQPRARQREQELYLVAISSPAGWLLRPPGRKGLLAGLWSWPWVPAPAKGEGQRAAEAGVPYLAAEGRSWPGWVQVYTHLRETVHPLALRLETRPAAPEGLAWVPAGDLIGLPMGRRDQRLRDNLSQPSSMLPISAEDWGAALAVLEGTPHQP
jgi:A/G-specific adenine glycosylase